jgi:nucleolar GTP-binding protein
MWGKKRIQVLDTPGLLDRPISERNPLELQAIVALRHHAKLILFLFDPSEICGYTLATQLNVYNEIRDLFGQVPFIIVINKLDILTQEQLAKIEGIIPSGSCVLRISAAKHEGIDLLMDTIFETLSMRSPEKTSGEAQS